MRSPILRWLVPGMIFPVLAAAQLPVFDLTFAPNPNGDVRAAAVQSDGKIIIIGGFTQVSGAARSNIARLNADGSADSTFVASISGSVQALALAPDGKVLVGGFFSTVNGLARNRLVRLNTDGSIDSTFNPVITGTMVGSILVLPDGRILIGGDFTTVSGQPRTGLARLNSNGTLDSTFIGDTSGTTIPDISAGVFVIARQLDGRILIGGQFGFVNGQTRRALARLSADGVLDSAFDPVGAAAPSIQTILVQRDGRFLVGGSLSTLNGQSRTNLGRFLADGSIDGSFVPFINNAVFSLSEQTDGKILIGGLFTSLLNSSHSYFARLNSDGTPDLAFTHDAAGPTIATGPGVQTIVETGDGRIVIGGSFTSASGVARSNLARLVAAPPGFASSASAPTAIAGQPYTLSVTITGTPTTYQWRKNGVSIPGATSSTYTIAQVQASDAGVYDLIATNSLGSATSAPITLGVAFAPQITAPPANAVAIAGSPSASFSVTATGTATLRYQWQRNGVNLAGATSSTLTLPTPTDADAGTYTVVVSNGAGSITSAPATLTVLPRARLANVSVRTALGAGQSVIVGFVVSGGSTDVLVRAAGPALTQFGVAGTMLDPRIELYRDSTKLVENDNWPSVLTATFASVGAFGFPANSRDAAVMSNLSGSHSVLTSGTGPGVVLVEAYDATTTSAGRLLNISALNQVGRGADVLIAGFSVTGNGPIRVLIRAVGPTLANPPFRVTGTLADPKLELYQQGGALLAENDNWDPSAAAIFTSAGAFQFTPGSKDAALITTLAAGLSYTVHVKGADDGIGMGLVEIYELP